MLLVFAVALIITETLNIDSTKNCNYLVVMMTVIWSLKMGDNVVRKDLFSSVLRESQFIKKSTQQVAINIFIIKNTR